MATFCFHIVDKGRLLYGVDLPSLEAAVAQATQIIREIVNYDHADRDLIAIAVEITDAQGTVLAEVVYDGDDDEGSSSDGSEPSLH